MLNIFLELWKAQQENHVVIQDFYFPDTFILDENHDFIWLFRSQSDGKMLRKKKQNAIIPSILKSLTGDEDQEYQLQGQQRWQVMEIPVATFSRLNDSGEIEIEHLTSDQTRKFFRETEYRSALPRDSIFLQKYLRNDSNEIHNHFIKVVYNQNYILIERKKNCYFWQQSEGNGARPKNQELYNCFLSFEAPEQFTEIEKMNDFMANQLKYLTKQICIQIESLHSKERGRIKQISLIFKKVQDIFYLIHCNEISFEKEQHIPKFWRVSFNNQFIVPNRLKYQKNLINNKNKSSTVVTASTSTSHSNQFFTKHSEDAPSIINNFTSKVETAMCNSCGEREEGNMKEIMKNKLQRIRIKRGIREQFNGLRPLYISQQKNEKALAEKYDTIKVCSLCFTAYQAVQKEDESLCAAYSSRSKTQITKSGRSSSFNIPRSTNCSFSAISGAQATPQILQCTPVTQFHVTPRSEENILNISGGNSCSNASTTECSSFSQRNKRLNPNSLQYLINRDLRFKFKEVRSKSSSRQSRNIVDFQSEMLASKQLIAKEEIQSAQSQSTKSRMSGSIKSFLENKVHQNSQEMAFRLENSDVFRRSEFTKFHQRQAYSNSNNNENKDDELGVACQDTDFLKKFYQQQVMLKEKLESQKLIQISQKSSHPLARQDYISLNHLSNNKCLRSEDILEQMRSINSSSIRQETEEHAKVISDLDKIYQDQKYQVELLKQKNSYIKQQQEYSYDGEEIVPLSTKNFPTFQPISGKLNLFDMENDNFVILARSSKNGGECNLLENIKNIDNHSYFQDLDSNRENMPHQSNLLNHNPKSNNVKGFLLPPKPLSLYPQKRIEISIQNVEGAKTFESNRISQKRKSLNLNPYQSSNNQKNEIEAPNKCNSYRNRQKSSIKSFVV